MRQRAYLRAVTYTKGQVATEGPPYFDGSSPGDESHSSMCKAVSAWRTFLNSASRLWDPAAKTRAPLL
jgi:hypothetical protein